MATIESNLDDLSDLVVIDVAKLRCGATTPSFASLDKLINADPSATQFDLAPIDAGTMGIRGRKSSPNYFQGVLQ
jgi:hypothetical protein